MIDAVVVFEIIQRERVWMRSRSAAAPGPTPQLWFIKNNVEDASGLRLRTAARLMARLFLLIALSLGASSIRSAEAQSGDLQGTVSVSGPDGQTQSLPGASLKLTPATPGRAPLSTVSNELGKYRFSDLAAGLYTMQVGLAGFKEQTRSVTVRPGAVRLRLKAAKDRSMKNLPAPE